MNASVRSSNSEPFLTTVEKVLPKDVVPLKQTTHWTLEKLREIWPEGDSGVAGRLIDKCVALEARIQQLEQALKEVYSSYEATSTDIKSPNWTENTVAVVKELRLFTSKK